MNTTLVQRRKSLALQLSVLLVLFGAALALLNYLGAFSGRSAFPHKVTYRVEGSAAQVYVTFTKDDGSQSARLDVPLPWQTSVFFNQRTTVILAVGNPTQTGDLECSLLLDGKLWKQERANFPQDKVACAGLVR